MQVTTISTFKANIDKYYNKVLITEESLFIAKEETGAVLVPQRIFNDMQRRLHIKAGQLIEITDIDAL